MLRTAILWRQICCHLGELATLILRHRFHELGCLRMLRRTLAALLPPEDEDDRVDAMSDGSSDSPDGDVSCKPLAHLATELLQSLGAGGRFLAVRSRDATASAQVGPPLVVPHRAAAISREWELVLSDGQDGAAPVAFETPFAEYAPASFWLHEKPPSGEAEARHQGGGGASRTPPAVRPFLLMPLHAMVDEHYTVYWCKPASEAEAGRPPRRSCCARK